MHEILRNLPSGSLVLDLGCAGGSFPREDTAATVVRVDRDAHGEQTLFVQGDAAKLPFVDRTFAAVISNHSLEHIDDLAGALREIGRVVSPGGSLFVAAPDASTLTDKLYRWLARGGGHVNAFTSPSEITAAIERATGLNLIATRVLCSSLSFLNRLTSRPPRRLLLLGGGHEWSLFLYAWLSRRFDRLLGTRTSIYGWAFYFGAIAEPIETETWFNVCIRCGSGCPASLLKGQTLFRSKSFLRTYRCAHCGATNPFTED